MHMQGEPALLIPGPKLDTRNIITTTTTFIIIITIIIIILFIFFITTVPSKCEEEEGEGIVVHTTSQQKAKKAVRAKEKQDAESFRSRCLLTETFPRSFVHCHAEAQRDI